MQIHTYTYNINTHIYTCELYKYTKLEACAFRLFIEVQGIAKTSTTEIFNTVIFKGIPNY